MAKLFEKYAPLIVESYLPSQTSGLHGAVHIRPIEGQGVSTTLRVSCSKSMMNPGMYPVGTRFIIIAKLTDRDGGGEYLYTPPRRKFEVLGKADSE